MYHFKPARYRWLGALLVAASISSYAASSETHDPKVWITVDKSKIATIEKQTGGNLLKQSNTTQTLDQSINKSPIEAIEINQSQISKIRALLHQQEEHGGFILHPDKDAALSAVLSQTKEPTPLKIKSELNQADRVQRWQSELKPENIVNVINKLASIHPNRYHSNGGPVAVDRLQAEWELLTNDSKQKVKFERFVSPKVSPMASLMMTIQGKSEDSVIIGAHLDSINIKDCIDTNASREEQGKEPLTDAECEKITANAIAPGADDDASGIATMTEVMKAALADNKQPDKTIRFIAYAAEEVGLWGSQQVANHFRANRMPVAGVMQLDMTNYRPVNPTADIYLMQDYTNLELDSFLRRVIKKYNPEIKIGETKCNYGCSDHASWTTNGYPAVFPAEADMISFNPNIHTPMDTIEKGGGANGHIALDFAKVAAAWLAEMSYE